MKKLFLFIPATILILLNIGTVVAQQHFGQVLCEKDNRYYCYKVRWGDSWDSLFPNPDEQDVVKRLNRINMSLQAGWVLAIPQNLSQLDHFDVSPFALKTEATGRKTIIVDLKKLAWGAYDQEGNLIHWGPASGGRGWCEDVSRPCRTQTGHYIFYRKQDYDCISNKFPFPTGGAAMPYCMHYFGPFALHGSFEVPGYNDSHGCIRIFITDARWLNHNFVDYDTKVIVKPYW